MQKPCCDLCGPVGIAMAALVGLATCALLLLLPDHVAAVPSPRSLESDLAILLHNDLYGS